MIREINNLSICIFNYLGKVFAHKSRMSETGITDFLFNHIILSSVFTGNIRLLKLKSNIESVFGNDLDLFVKVGTNQYKWFVFQAKVAEYTGAFNDLKKRNKLSFPQWYKLKIHQLLFDSQPYYLFYYGQSSIKSRKIKGNIGFTDCMGNANYRELGLSAVELDEVIKNRKGKGISQLTYFKDFFPNNVRAFRYFFCQNGIDKTASRYYSLEEIIETRYYNEINLESLKESMNESDEEDLEEIIIESGQGNTRIVLDLQSD
ncbi:MAG: hypothetical protein HOO91_03825 [Bacteroidales bacterium]|nr:hypothetical protein [Bacteroidales bacterium]